MDAQFHLFEGVAERATDINAYRRAREDLVIQEALEILECRLAARHTGVAMRSPDAVKGFLKLRLAERQREVFACLFLDNRHRLLRHEELFQGTIDAASVYPREVVKAAITANAAAVIFAHNHPSGVTEPSRADKVITDKLTEALALVGIRVLDHLIVGEGEPFSFAERGLI